MNARTSVVVVVVAWILGACAHPIAIGPLESASTERASFSQLKVAYAMTDADRSRQFTSNGGGSDMISYFPYRDLERAIRDALRALYADVFVVKSATDSDAIRKNEVGLVFVPQISTASGSSSIFTWPPTQFSIDLACDVSDAEGKPVTRIRAVGSGTAEFSEFKSDPGLAGRRAASDLVEKLKQAVRSSPQLR